MNPYEVVEAFEHRVAEYAGSIYGVAVNSCTNAILLALMLHEPLGEVTLPKRTYVGVAQSVINAGGVCRFVDNDWVGEYELEPEGIIDSARRFYRGMALNDGSKIRCLSFHWYKHLPIGRGGVILTNSAHEYRLLKRMRYDGRRAGVAPVQDDFDVRGYHCYMIPEDAARGLMLMNAVKDHYEDIPWDDYADLSQFEMFTGGE